MAVYGDLNAICYQHEERRGRLNGRRQVALFNDFINGANLIQVDFNGVRFSWSNNCRGLQCVFSKIE